MTIRTMRTGIVHVYNRPYRLWECDPYTSAGQMSRGAPGGGAITSPGRGIVARQDKSGRTWKIVRIAVSAGLVVAIFWFVLPQVADVGKMWDAVSAMTPMELVSLGAFGAWNLVTYWLVNMAVLPELSLGRSVIVTESATAVANTVPGGSAISIGLTYAMYRSWGFSKSRTTVALMVSGIWNNFAKLAMPVLALALLALQGKPSAGRIAGGAIGIASLVGAVLLFAAMLRTEAFARKAGIWAGRRSDGVRRLLKRPPATGWDDATSKFRGRVIGLLHDRWLVITATTIIGHFSLFLVLLVALRHVGVSEADVNWIEALAVFAFVRLATAIPLTPGGLGVVELGLIAGLATAGGDRAEVAAAVLVFRALTYLVPIPFGLITYLIWRKSTWSHPTTEPESDAEPAVAVTGGVV